MTPGEWAKVKAAAPDVLVVVTQWEGGVEVSREGGGEACAFYNHACTVYAVRPGVCRAFGCFGTNGTMAGMLKRVGESAGVRRVALKMFDAAERWTKACE